MLLVSRLARKLQSRRDETQIKEQEKARETERNLQWETRNCQQAQALLVALHELQRKMDPLIAAQVYNNRICPLSRLPEELLLRILDFLYDDPVTLHCIQLVSRIFLRLLNQQSAAWTDTWYHNSLLPTKGNSLYLHDTIRIELRRLLQRDGRCDKCRRWNNAHTEQLYDACKFRQQGHESPKLHCGACSSLHDVRQFSFNDQQPWKMQAERRCLGQQGSVELCEHVQVYWSSIKSHIDNWRHKHQHESGDWQTCLDSFKIECHDAIHDTRCTTLEPPTWPRARLGTCTFNSRIVVLYLEWLPHNRIDALNLTADGRIPATGLRTMFQQVRRRGPADILCPPFRPDAPPEMALFGQSPHVECLISYNTGEEDEATTPPTAALPWILWASALGWYRGRPEGANGTKLEIKPHFPSDANDSSISSMCLVANYKKDIMICQAAALSDTSVPIVPTHHWLHAMDIRTYPHPQANNIRPPCMDMSCVNYYRGRGEYYCCPPYC